VTVTLPRPLAHDSYLHRRNPTVKLGVLLVVSGALLFVFDPWTPAILYLLALVGVRLGGRTPWRVLAIAHVPFVLFAFSLFTVNVVARRGEPIWSWGVFDLTQEGIVVGSSLALRTLVIGTGSIAFVLTTDGTRLMTSLHQQLRLSPRLTYAVLAGYRLLEQLPAEWQTIRMAQAVRVTGRRPGTLPRSPRILTRAAFGLLVTALRRGERIAIALETRGLGRGPRTVFRPVPLERDDWLFAAGVLSCYTAVYLLAAAAGWLRGPGALGGVF
jgi:energy-coupling factor transport system permease protein